MSNYRDDRFNGAGYYDPTAFAAMRNIEREERRQKEKPRCQPPLVYICSPYRGDTGNNVQNALRYCRFAVGRGFFPLAPHCYLPRFLDDDKPAERELALSFGLRLLNGCREIWVFGDKITEGMRLEIDAAKKRHMRIRQFTENMKEG